MSWQQPTDFEKRLVEPYCQPWEALSPLLRLCRLLSLATRIEPLLLRNARQHFLPGSNTEIESLLWFSPLVGARSSREVILHPGVSRRLAEELQKTPDRFAAAIEFVRRHTRHWSPEDRLEQDLRLDTLDTLGHDNRSERLQAGLQDMLRLIHGETEPKRRVRLARSVRQTLATIGNSAESLDEQRWLRQYASQRLGTSAALAADSPAAEQMPAWLQAVDPQPFRCSLLAVELRHAAGRQPVLRFNASTDEAQAIRFPTPLPADLHVQALNQAGRWHIVSAGKQLPMAAMQPPLVLTTAAGSRYELRASLPHDDTLPPEVSLIHLADDRELALKIAAWLKQQNIPVDLREEGGREVDTAAADEEAPAPKRLLRLWTAAAQKRLAGKAGEPAPPADCTLLLRADPRLKKPSEGFGADAVIDLPDLGSPAQSVLAADFLRQINDWLTGKAAAIPLEPPAADQPSQVDRLLAELKNPETKPPRRLKIGDRLAEIGDPRPGVGVREYLVPSDAEQLVGELESAQTIPPRRLEIGNRLAEIGDPRRGVGLDSRGLPEIDWVEIPGGEFLYQEGERRTLPTFRIARYPVTNAQYQAFVDSQGYNDKRWWEGLKRPESVPSRWPQPNRPRTNVDWYEAVAFSRWLSEQLGDALRLPNELEWERAARGRDGREYPWGNRYESGLANVNEKVTEAGEWYLEETTAVGMYPQGASSEGVCDLSGNVWEWCLNQYAHPEQVAVDSSGQARVLRGGSWGYDPVLARGSNRGRGGPDGRVSGVGFRVVSSAPIA